MGSSVNCRRKAIRDLNALQAKLSDHLDEMEQYAKSKSKDVQRLDGYECSETC